MNIILDKQGDKLPVTQEILKIVSGDLDNRFQLMIQLLNKLGDKIIITEEVF